MISAIPIALSILQIFLLVTIFRYDTPVFLKLKGDNVRLNELMSKIYHPYVVQERIAELEGEEQLDGVSANNADEDNISYGKVCCDPRYSRATFVGCSIAIFQQLTGINVIMFYSNTVFALAHSSLKASTITGIVGVVNFLATFGGMALLGYVGRKPLLLYTTAALAIINGVVGYALFNSAGTLMISGVLVFIIIFELGPGPITWLYMAEIMQDKGSSVATVMNWGINLLISYFVPVIIKKIGDDNVGYIFYFMGAASVVGTLFIGIFMKETKGKSVAQIEEMFDKSNTDLNVKRPATNDSNFNST